MAPSEAFETVTNVVRILIGCDRLDCTIYGLMRYLTTSLLHCNQ